MSDENSDIAVDLDLFGNPIVPMRDRRGRPSYQKTKENQRLVTDLAAFGWSSSRIATFMRCDPKTLVKHFSRELEHGKTIVEGEAILVQTALMRQGKLRAAEKVLERAGAALQKNKTPAKETKGKKEALRDGAAKPPSGWGEILGEDLPN